MNPDLPPDFVLAVFRDLRRRRFGIGAADLLALRSALRAGFGWRSDIELVELCVALWASSAAEADAVRALFTRHAAPAWNTTAPASLPADADLAGRREPAGTTTQQAPVPVPARVAPAGGLPPLPQLAPVARRAVFAAQYPVTRREVAQAFRRLRRPIAVGPATELDVAATIDRRSRAGVAVPPVTTPRTRYQARLLLLVDRQGSMTPFHPYTEYVRDAIAADGGLQRVDVAYFHDIPVDRPDPQVLRGLQGPAPVLDPVLDTVAPSVAGTVFADPGLLDPLPLGEVVDRLDPGTGVVVLSDAGAARGRLDPARNAASVAFVRALRAAGHRVAWLNPLPVDSWTGSSAAHLARHVPLLPLDAAGLHQVVDVLRGRPMPLERAA